MIDNLFLTSASLIKLGGPVVAILMVLSVLALAIILMKLFQFAVQRVGRRNQVQ